jgi:mRNA interferase MazF
MQYEQYQIVVINLDPTVGAEIQKKRLCVIVSPNEMNQHLDTIVVCPITSKSQAYPTRVDFELEGQTNYIVVDQIRTVDKHRISEPRNLLALEQETIEELKSVIKQTFVD